MSPHTSLTAILLLCASSLAQPERLEKKMPFQPVVVRTWGDLFDQRELTLSDGTRIRVGLEASEVPEHASFLVYAMIHGGKYRCQGEQPLGPLTIKMIVPKDHALFERRKFAADFGNSSASEQVTQSLFAAPVAVGKSGKYELHLHDPDGKVVAAVDIQVKGKNTAAWLAFSRPDELRERRLLRANEPVTERLGMSHSFHASPICPGYATVATRPDRGREIPLTQELPRWRFDEPDPRLTLSAAQNLLCVESAFDMHLTYPRDHFLYRIWVNGKLYTPSRDSKYGAEKRGGDRVVLNKKLHIDWEFDAKIVGARKGDKVAVQMLYCPDGWRELGNLAARATDDILKLSPRWPVLSPKAEFTVR
jgi:hypothetical protein